MPTEEEIEKIIQTYKQAGIDFICNTCATPVSSFKKLKFCQFCAQSNCFSCAYKSRPFPEMPDPENIKVG